MIWSTSRNRLANSYSSSTVMESTSCLTLLCLSTLIHLPSGETDLCWVIMHKCQRMVLLTFKNLPHSLCNWYSLRPYYLVTSEQGPLLYIQTTVFSLRSWKTIPLLDPHAHPHSSKPKEHLGVPCHLHQSLTCIGILQDPGRSTSNVFRWVSVFVKFVNIFIAIN